MSEKNKQTKRALKEAQQAEKETASTLAVGRSRGTNTAGTLIKSVLTFLALLLLIGLSVG